MTKRLTRAGRVTFCSLMLMASTVLLAQDGLSLAQGRQSLSSVAVEGWVVGNVIVPGQPFEMRVKATIARGLHINSDKPKESYLIPTKVTFSNPADFAVREIRYPNPVMRTFEFSKNALAVYEGTIEIMIRAVAQAKLPLGAREFSAVFQYQACDNHTCYAPQKLEFKIPVEVVRAKK